jgi:hypothetical protein
MKLIPILVVVLFAASTLAQAPNSAPPPSLERLCGKLEHVQNVPVKDAPNTIVSKARDLPRVAVRLYPAGENGQSCEGASAIATTATGHWGSFGFKSKQLPGGLYWLQVEPNERKYRMLIRYAPKRYSDQSCSETLWEVNDSGDFWRAQIITVD